MVRMGSGLSKAAAQEYGAKVILTLLFLGLVGLAGLSAGPERLSRALSSWSITDLALTGLATFRLGRLVAFDRVMEPLRHPFARTVPDETGAGESVEPAGIGARQAVGQLLTCPICAGTWIAAGLVSGLVWLPDLTRFFLWMTAAIGLVELFQAGSEALCWTGQLNRTLAGRALSERVAKEKLDERFNK